MGWYFTSHWVTATFNWITYFTFFFLQKSSHPFGCTGEKPSSSSFTNIMERAPPANHQSSTHHRHHNVNHALSSRVPRHYYSIKHSQRNTANHAVTSTSHGKTTVRDEKHTWKLGLRPESGFRYYAGDIHLFLLVLPPFPEKSILWLLKSKLLLSNLDLR